MRISVSPFRAVLVLVALSAGAASCSAQMHAPSPLPTVHFPPDSASVVLGARIARNKIVIPMHIESSGPIDCILDTGARGTVIFGDSVTRALGLVPAGRAQIRGAGGGGASVEGSVHSGLHLHAGPLEIADAMVVTMPDSAMRTSPLSGLMAIGRGVFEGAVAEFDWDRSLVRFHDPARFRAPAGAVGVPMEAGDAGQMYVRVKVTPADGQPFEARVLLDTGASHTLQLEPGKSAKIVAPPGAKRERIGLGATGVVYGAIGRATSVEFGGVTFRDVPVTFADASLGLGGDPGRMGNLGSGLLRRFRAFVDLPHRTLWLLPGASVNEPLVLPSYDEASMR